MDIASPLEIQLCGHSLGGALAVLAALDVAVNLQSMVRAAIILSIPDSTLSNASGNQVLYDTRVMQASMLPRCVG